MDMDYTQQQSRPVYRNTTPSRVQSNPTRTTQQRTTQPSGVETPSRVQQRQNTPVTTQPTRSRVQNEPISNLKPKWYAPQQSSSGMVTPQFRYQSNDGGFGFNGPGAFQRNY
jgi:anti-sigma28 factor (negative regulator of flagellin synthesis)